MAGAPSRCLSYSFSPPRLHRLTCKHISTPLCECACAPVWDINAGGLGSCDALLTLHSPGHCKEGPRSSSSSERDAAGCERGRDGGQEIHDPVCDFISGPWETWAVARGPEGLEEAKHRGTPRLMVRETEAGPAPTPCSEPWDPQRCLRLPIRSLHDGGVAGTGSGHCVQHPPPAVVASPPRNHSSKGPSASRPDSTQQSSPHF